MMPDGPSTTMSRTSEAVDATSPIRAVLPAFASAQIYSAPVLDFPNPLPAMSNQKRQSPPGGCWDGRPISDHGLMFGSNVGGDSPSISSRHSESAKIVGDASKNGGIVNVLTNGCHQRADHEHRLIRADKLLHLDEALAFGFDQPPALL